MVSYFLFGVLISVVYIVGVYKGRRKEHKDSKELFKTASSNNQLLDMVYNHFDLNDKP
jgi:hypothetical protein